jgi:hypothetical protein
MLLWGICSHLADINEKLGKKNQYEERSQDERSVDEEYKNNT